MFNQNIKKTKNLMKTIALYHGTNSIFLDSIKLHGLGGLNIVKETNAISLLRELDDLAESEIQEKYMGVSSGSLRMSVICMCGQQPGTQINWQHGNVYLTPSIKRAMRYAVKNKLGSELFSHIKHLSKLLTHNNISASERILDSYPEAKKIISESGRPIVIEIGGLNTDDLSDEGGESPENIFNEVLYVMKNSANQDNESLEDFGFRLNKTIEFGKLIIHEINLKIE